ncbi:peptidase [uncultured Jannaschia sp.]|uniref:peptidase n=1 Tax=uncultured Jannaschia sp. TaxID=293347 RepID=UPI00262EACEE|nr:peptidase [uncultured Jannaschia sp.]
MGASRFFAAGLELWLTKYEQRLKWLAVYLGIASTVAIVQDWDPWPMLLGLPFCIIWMLCAWLHGERQLKYLNVLFSGLYVYGVMRWLMLAG